jgi:hypothetical protein
MEFKVGDKVLLDTNSGACFNGEYIVEVCEQVSDHSCTGKISVKNPMHGMCHCSYSWKLISSSNKTMAEFRDVPQAQKLAMTEQAQALYRVGIFDSSGNIADSSALNRALLRLNYKALVAQAEADIKESEEEVAAQKIKKV